LQLTGHELWSENSEIKYESFKVGGLILFMTLIPQELLLSFEQYEAMQEAHLKSVETETLPDMEKHNFERARAFEDMKNHLSIMLRDTRREGGDALQIAMACQERLATIMERDEILARQIGKYRDDLEQRLRQMRHGKKALQGYGQAGSANSPEFVNEPG
jgi:hypothetical protein